MKYIFSTMVITGIATLLFTAGASDFGLEFKYVFFGALIGLGLLVVGYRGLTAKGGVKQ